MQGIETAYDGVVVTDPSSRTSANGKAVLSFLVAVGNGDEAQFVQTAVFGDLAAGLAGKVAKGSKVYAEGRIRLNSWPDRTTGEQKHGLSVAAWKCELLGQIGRKRQDGAPQRCEGKTYVRLAPTDRAQRPLDGVRWTDPSAYAFNDNLDDIGGSHD